MSKELARREEMAVSPRTVYEVLGDLARDPTVDLARITGLFDLQIKAEQWDAEKQFTAAFSRLKFPPITRNRKGHTAKYAAYEDIQEIIEPILSAEGFVLTFSSGEPTPQGIPIHGTLAHVAGHAVHAVLYLPPDGVATRAGGMNMNALQATGSTTSYGMRYLAKMMLNLRFIGEDNDGASFGAITEAKAKLLDRAIATVGASKEKFLEIYGVKAVSELPKGMLAPARTQIEAKYRKQLQDVGADDAEIREKLTGLWV
jgi:hypothetical protein